MRILGVHEVEAPDPCCLVEVQFEQPEPDYDWAAVTQEEPGQPQANWQVAYDERPLDEVGNRWAFFFHFLDWKRPLLTPDGQVALPSPSPLPEHLREIEYEEP